MTDTLEETSYLDASQELQAIVDGLKGTQHIDVDELMAKVDRAKHLIDFCGRKIKRAEVHVRSVLEELKRDGSDEAAAPF